MPSGTEGKSDPRACHLQGELTVFRAADVKQTLLANPPPLEIDLSGVTDIDTAGVQLLMLAKRAALADGRELRLTAHSPVVIEVFELLNIAAYFGDLLPAASRAGALADRASAMSRPKAAP